MMRIIKVAAASLFTTYLMTAFIKWELSPAAWGDESRGFATCLAITIFVTILAMR